MSRIGLTGILGILLAGFLIAIPATALSDHLGRSQVIGGMTVHLGLMPVGALRGDPNAYPAHDRTKLPPGADMHHVMLRAVSDSYTLMEPGASLPVGDMVNIIGRRVADSFALGLRLAALFVIVGLTYYIGLGLLGRLMPQLQVFFFGLPVQIGLQIWVLAITVTGIMMVFLEKFKEAYQSFILP